MNYDDLDALIRRVDPDRWLSSRFIADESARVDVIALYAFDHELARAPKVASEPLLGEIRLTWWGEVLEEIFEGRPVRRHPTAEALARAVRRHDLPRAPLEAMIQGRYRELDRAPMSTAEAIAWAEATAGQAAAAAARLLDPVQDPAAPRAAGQAWALSVMERNGAGPHLTEAVALALKDARSAPVSPAAFPAVAHAAFARAYADRKELSDLGKRIRLTWAVARGHI
ncbi:squalene/phytoene synthase family protein [Phenylobacterium sp.]|jgi:phytoene synthase|uniref:squalene/phytoene synthase family protein n=1 Tax=Phenylobacterium sp. TaxID=1871053 RepID=UPI002E36FF62|nr:squalene/phytoene synthase family protein [Phenylobacterium sp.]HEX2560538.1 squalene/phytoene synthase family protein [Phenylobacterium sp.]